MDGRSSIHPFFADEFRYPSASIKPLMPATTMLTAGLSVMASIVL
jgi:hypothetical protein